MRTSMAFLMGMGVLMHFNGIGMDISWECQKGDTSLTNSTYVHHLLRGSLITGGWLNPHESYKSWVYFPNSPGYGCTKPFLWRRLALSLHQGPVQIGFMDVFKRLHHVTSQCCSQNFICTSNGYTPIPSYTTLYLSHPKSPLSHIFNPRSRWKLPKTLMFQDYWRPQLSC